MTTILADAHLGVMLSDSNISDGTRVWSQRKVFRVRGSLIGIAGSLPQAEDFVKWFKAGADPLNWKFKLDAAYILILNQEGLFEAEHTNHSMRHVKSGREAIGSGGMAALAAYEALGWGDPRQAVKIACKHDAGSRTPVRMYKL